MAWIIFAMAMAALTWWALKSKSTPDDEPPRHTELGSAWFKSHKENLKDGLLGWPIGYGIPLGHQRVDDGSTFPRLAKIRYVGKNAGIIVAPPRSGKFRDIECAILLESGLGRPPKPWPDCGEDKGEKASSPDPPLSSCIVIDPKGQAAACTAPHRARMGQRVILLNPFHIWPDHLGPNNPYFNAWPPVMGPRPKDFEGAAFRCIFDGHYNPMPVAGTPRFAEDCTKRADGCVVREGQADGDSKYFYDKAKHLIAGIIGEVAEGFPFEERNMAQVAKIIADGSFSIMAVAREAMMRGASNFITRALKPYTNLDNIANLKEVESIISTAQGQMAFISASPHISENLSGPSSFEWAELKRIPTTVYLILPLDEMETSKKWFRLIIESACAQLMSESTDGPYSTLMILDEFVQLGHLDIMTTVMNAGAGRGLRAWPIVQNLPDLQALYGKKYLSFLSACGVQLFFAPRDPDTAKYIQDKSGLKTVVVPSWSSSYSTQPDGKQSFSGGTSTGLHSQPLVHGYEAAQMANNLFCLFDETGKLTIGERVPYYQDLTYQEFLAAPDPNEKDSVTHPFWHVPWPQKQP